MRKKNFILLALAVLSMVGFTSCLSSNGDKRTSAYAFLRVESYMGSTSFYDPSGLRIVPSTQLSETPSSQLVYAYMEYNPEDMKEGTTSLQVTNFTYSSLTSVSSVYEAPTSSTVTCSISSTAMIWGQNRYCIVPVTFYVKNTASQTEATEEWNKHSFCVYADKDKDLKDGVLTIHLRHVVSDLDTSVPEGTLPSSVYTSSTGNYMYFPLTQFANMLDEQGNAPKKIKIAYQRASSYSVEVVKLDAQKEETVTNEISLASN